METMSLVLRRLIPSAYRPVLANRVFRRLSLGFAVSYLGDGMSFLAVPWLAIELAPEATEGLWVGGAVAAYTLPGVVGALVFGRRLRRVSARRLLLADNVVRGVFLGAVPLAWLAGMLTLPLYVVLLAVSSLLHAWGSAGKYTLLAELLPDEQRLAANTLVSSLNFAATIAGPAIAGVLVTFASAALVLGLDALTYVFLAVLVAADPAAGVGARLRRRPGGRPRRARVAAVPSRAARAADAHLVLQPAVRPGRGRAAAARDGRPACTGHGARPVLDAVRHRRGARRARGRRAAAAAAVAGDDRHRGRLGALAAAVRVRRADWSSPSRASRSAARSTDRSYALSVTLMQAKSPPQHLAAMLAARSAALLTASPLGTALGGPLTTALGPRATLGGSGLATVAARRPRVRAVVSPEKAGDRSIRNREARVTKPELA